MSAAIIDDADLQLLATISAEEKTLWPDDIAFEYRTHELTTSSGNRASLKNYSFNVERRRATIEEKPDTILACEIIEHLIRAPHVMLLNANDWLEVNGLLFLSTPNGCQFVNPLRRRSRSWSFRAHCYERHTYEYRLKDLINLVELCGFRVLEAGFWSPYPSKGSRRISRMLAGIPGDYFTEKFERSIFIAARKERSITMLESLPMIYVPSEDWEFIDNGAGRTRPTKSN
jgi:hypothetical protein